MKYMNMFSAPVLTATLFIICGTGWSADSPKLVVPIYKGAVPGILADGVKANASYVGNFSGMKALDCTGRIGSGAAQQAGEGAGPWCFLTRDPIDKVKAYYEKVIGPMHAINGEWQGRPGESVKAYAGYAERALIKSEFEAEGFAYRGLSLHALPQPPVLGKETKNTDDTWQGQEAFKFYSSSRHFGGFLDAVDWFGDPSKRKPDELHAVYKKHNRLESAFFQRKGTKLEAVDETLRVKRDAKRAQGQNKAMGAMPGQMSPAQMGQMPSAMPANQHGTPEDKEINAFMKKNPKVANRYVELTKKLNTLMQQGKFEEADAVDEELQQLINRHPELAALEGRADERSAAASAAGQARENQMMSNYGKQMDQAIWGNALDYINAVEKEAYYTLIVIDNGFKGNEKNYTRDHAVIAKETNGWVLHTNVWDITYKQGQGAQKTESAPEKKDAVGDTVKEGLKSLKSLF